MEGELPFRKETEAGSRRGHRSPCLEEKRGHGVSQGVVGALLTPVTTTLRKQVVNLKHGVLLPRCGLETREEGKEGGKEGGREKGRERGRERECLLLPYNMFCLFSAI